MNFGDTISTAKAYTGVTADGSLIIAAFRGSYSVQDWVRNLELKREDIATGPFAALAGQNLGVHAAWKNNYIASFRKPPPGDIIANLLGLMRQYPAATVQIVGHSMGAALAQFCAVDLLLQPEAAGRTIKLVTFGGVRTGDSKFAAYMRQHFGQSGSFYRVVNYKDPAPHLPALSSGYEHAGREMWIGPAFKAGGTLQPTDVRQANDQTAEDPEGAYLAGGGCKWSEHPSYISTITGTNCLKKTTLGEVSIAGMDAWVARARASTADKVSSMLS